MLESNINGLAAKRRINEDMKARDMLRWVAEMNSIKASTEEIVMQDCGFDMKSITNSIWLNLGQRIANIRRLNRD